ncbi:MAG: MATE family efflux transporter [Tissierellia bacterium]|nr:MATE family efflux transporter [Tissierellia bacterium]
MNQQEQRQLLLTKNTKYLIMTLCVPGIIGMVVIALYSFMDSIYAGQMISKEAMAAISVAYPITLINNSMATLFGIGGASVLSRAIGAKDEKTIQSVLPTVTKYLIIVSILTTILGFFGARHLVGLTGAKGDILEQAITYCRLIFLGSLFVNFTQGANMLIRSEGRMMQAMVIMGIGALINIILDPIFILAFPHWGVQSVAYATLISQVSQAMITLYYFKNLSPSLKMTTPRINTMLTKPILAVGISAMIMQLFGMIQQLLFFNVAQTYGGNHFTILMSVFLRIQMFAFIPLWGMSQGFQPYVGTNFGAKAYKRLLKGRRHFMMAAFALTMIFFLPIQLFPKTILSMFITDTNMVIQAVLPIRLFFSTFFLYGFMVMMGVYFQSIGDAKTAGIIIIGRNLFLFLPLIFLMPRFLGKEAIWYVQAICDILVLTYGFYKFIAHGKLLQKEPSMAA